MTAVAAPAGVGASVGRLAERLDGWHVTGAEVAVVRDGATLLAGGVGRRGVDDAAPVTSSTLFDHGSCGKAFTGLLAALLHEDGTLDLDAPVRRYLPELRLADEVVAQRVRLRDLLSHRSGLGRHDLAWILNPSWSRPELVRRLEFLPMCGDLRAQWDYSNLGFTLAGVVVERVTGSSFEQQVHERILEPLGMTRTFTSVEAALADADHATPHVLREDKPAPTPWRALRNAAPAGGLVLCADDAVRWLRLQAGGTALSPSAVAVTQQPQVVIPPGSMPYAEIDLVGYGLGWVTGRYRGRRMVWHSGGVDGFLTQTMVLPEDGVGVLVAANQHMSGLPLAAVLDLVDDLIGEVSEPSWFDRLDPAYLPIADDDGPADPGEDGPASDRPEPSRGPVHVLSRYAGTFRDAGYGDLVVTADAQGLAVRIGDEPLTVRHRNLDTWDLRYEPLDHDLVLTFVTDAGGNVAEAVVPMDPASAPVRFVRVDGEASP